MLLTEAVRIVSTLSRAVCDQTAVDATADPLLRAACRWRTKSPVKFAQLVDLAGVGQSCRLADQRSQRGVDSVRACILAALTEADDWTRATLGRRCGCTSPAVGMAIARLRHMGHAIQWGGGARAVGYCLVPPPVATATAGHRSHY